VQSVGRIQVEKIPDGLFNPLHTPNNPKLCSTDISGRRYYKASKTNKKKTPQYCGSQRLQPLQKGLFSKAARKEVSPHHVPQTDVSRWNSEFFIIWPINNIDLSIAIQVIKKEKNL